MEEVSQIRKQKREDGLQIHSNTDLTDKPKTKLNRTFLKFPFNGLHVLSLNPGNQALILRLLQTLVLARAKRELRVDEFPLQRRRM